MFDCHGSFFSVCIYGGGNRREQIAIVEKGVDIVIGKGCVFYKSNSLYASQFCVFYLLTGNESFPFYFVWVRWLKGKLCKDEFCSVVHSQVNILQNFILNFVANRYWNTVSQLRKTRFPSHLSDSGICPFICTSFKSCLPCPAFVHIEFEIKPFDVAFYCQRSISASLET